MSARIRIKFSGRITPQQNPDYWISLFPGRTPIIDNCEFIFDPDSRDYDWLAVYDDLMLPENSLKGLREERLACSRENTILITQEPPPIKIYGPNFLSQYGHVLSPQPAQFLAHKNHILQVAPIRWFYGCPLGENDHNYIGVDEFSQQKPPQKTRDISTVCSNKQMSPAFKRRFEFTKILASELGSHIDWFGRGVRPVNDKSEAMNDYKYHVALENHIYPHYWTEKIADCFLAFCLPFYYGPDNIVEYFPAESFIPIDTHNTDHAVEALKKAVSDNVYESRLPAILRARELVLTDYNLMNVVAGIVSERHQHKKPAASPEYILGRHAFRRRHPIAAAKDLAFRRKCRAELT